MSLLPQRSQIELLTQNFYDWERRGRGWQVWPSQVEPEPPFRPFFGHFVPSTTPVQDDARKPTFFSSLADRLAGRSTGAADSDASSNPREEEFLEPEPTYLDESPDLVELQVSIPPTLKITKDIAEQFLLSLTYCSHAVSFEIIGFGDAIVVQLVCADRDAKMLQNQLQAYFPDATVTMAQDFLSQEWKNSENSFVVDFGM